MKRHVLLAVCGLNPQVITETFYCLYKIRKVNIKEIYILTTLPGKEKLRRTLIDSKIFQKLCKKLKAIDVKFGEETIYMITNRNGEPLKDIRTLEDNERVAEILWNIIKEFTDKEEIILHCSVAGGRKTMGVYAAIIMSLLGRREDRLYHVLVAEEKEASDFYYPLKKKDEKSLILAEIPYVKLREVFEISEKRLSFVQRIKNYQKELTKLKPSKVVINFENRIIDGEKCGKFRLSQREFFVYSLFAEKRRTCSCEHGCNKCFLRVDEFLQDEDINIHLSRYERVFFEIQETLKRMNKATLREIISRINKKIDESDILMKSLFKIQKMGREKDYRYGIKIKRSMIHVSV